MEQNHFALQVIRVHRASSHTKDAAFYVEVKLANSYRKTGILNGNGEPIWNAIVTFSQTEASTVFKIRLKEARKLGRDNLIGLAEVNVDGLLVDCDEDNARVVLSAPTGFLPNRKRQSLTGSIYLHLKNVDTLNRAKIEIETAEKSTERIRTLTNGTDSTMEVIGTVIEAAEVIIDMVDDIAKIHPLFHLSWQATSALFKLVSHQFHTDSELIDLVDKMKTAFSFSREARNLDDKTKMLKPMLRDLLTETAECSRFVQEYSRHGFPGRMSRLSSGRKISDYSARFVNLRNELDSVIGLNTAREVLDIRIQQQLEALLEPSKSDPNSVSKRPRCLDGTRQEYLDPIMEFLFAETSPNVLWLTGAGGCGKSTIAVTASDKCGVTCPPAYMFFEREKSDPSSVIRTIAYELALLHPSISGHILAALEAHKTICGTTIKIQFERLLVEPLHAISDSLEGPVVVILDALDECGSVEQRRELLELLKTNFKELPSKVRVLVTSRPEGDITEDLVHNDGIQHIELVHDTKESRQDVDRYLQLAMKDALGEDMLKVQDLEAKHQVLCDAADGLFIWASTAVKMVQGTIYPGRSLLKLVDNFQSVGGHGLDGLYATALEGSGVWQPDSKDEGTAILEFILVGKEAMTGTIIAAFLGLAEDTVDRILRRLRSVISYEPEKPVRLHHASFADYLLSPKRSGGKAWHIDESKQKQAVTDRCFDVMAESLSFNICKIESSFLRNKDILDLQTRIANNIRPHLGYACRFWAVHLCELSESDVSTELKDRVKKFGKEYLLYWFEVLSLTDQFNRAATALRDASLWSTSIDDEISSLFWEADRLASIFAYPISQSAPHIYLSAISLSKGESSVADLYSESHPVVEIHRFGTRTPVPCMKVFKEHTDRVLSVAISPDGRRIASGSRDRTIRIWNAFNGEQISKFKGDAEVRSVAFSPDSKRVVSGSGDGTIRVWDVDLGQLVSGPFKAGDSEVNSVEFSADGERVVSVADGKIFVFYSDSGELVSVQFEDDIGIRFHKLSPDGKYVLGAKDGKIGIWDTGTGKRVSAPFRFNAGNTWSYAVSPDGKRVVTGSTSDGMIRVWNASGKLITGPFKAHVWSVSFSADGKRVVSAGGEVAVWDVDSGQCIWGPFKAFKEHTPWITSVIFTPDGKRVISGSKDGTIRTWDVDGSPEIASGAFEAHTGEVRCLAFSPDGKRIVSGSDDKTIHVWDVDSCKHLAGPFKGHTNRVASVAFLPDGERVISSSRDGTIRVWDGNSGELILGPLEGHTGSVRSIVVFTDGKRIVTGSSDGSICIWDADSSKPVLGPLRAHTRNITSVAFSLDGKRIASGSWDGTMCIWDTGSGELVLGPLKGKSIRSVTFHPDGKHVASSSGDETICIWDVDSGEFVSQQLKEYTSGVQSLGFSRDGKLVVYGYRNGAIRIWDVHSGDPVCGPLKRHTGWVWSVMFSPDGNRVTSGSGDKIIHVWDVSSVNAVLRVGKPAVGARSGSPTPHDGDRDVTHDDKNTGQVVSTHRETPNWTLTDDGWVKGKQGELLIWIPEDMHRTLWTHRTIAILSCQFSTKLEFLNSPVGENWSEGYPRK